MIFQLLVFVYLITAAFSSPISPHLFCEEKRWQSIIVFFATHYFAHALATVPDPGENYRRSLVSSIRRLLLPNLGLVEAIKSVIYHIVQGGSDELHGALAQKALLILVRTEDIVPGDIKFHNVAKSLPVHGEFCIPPGYSLICPSYRQHRHEMAPALRNSKNVILGRSTEVASPIVAIAQVIFSLITIYRTRGDQTEKYGYAAYGLSVYPYALMSLANMTKLLVCGRYPFLCVLRTATVVEAEKNGGIFEGAVGNFRVDHWQSEEVVSDSQHDELTAAFSEPPSWVSPFPSFRPQGDYRNYKWIVPIIGSIIFVIAIISHPVFVLLVSGFNRGQSTRAQRIWMLGWLIANGVSAVSILISSEISSMERLAWATSPISYLLSVFDILAPYLGSRVGGMLIFPTYVFAIGGFVTVGGMLRAESHQLCNI